MEKNTEKFDLRGFEFSLSNKEKSVVPRLEYDYSGTEQANLKVSRLNFELSILRSRFSETSKPTRVEISLDFKDSLVQLLQQNHLDFDEERLKIWYEDVELTIMPHLIGGELNVTGYHHI